MKQRKFAVCTFWATSASVSAKQKELAPLKQLFVLTLQPSPPLHAQKVRTDLHAFFATLLRSLGVGVFFLLIIAYFPFCLSYCCILSSLVFHCHPERNEV
ncbi:MAG: hypothetical protein IKY99_02475 [Bacteroidaceae bacterium]|nr:hypothetical protein [Bacteroidaceae bacterium]